ncbi:hypothetical protein SMX68_004095 [Cronobacter sakazakii]|nr:hypothetical protein [Cronobacter sakazakii]ELY3796814.1 hypothetical protein [Cronobacter sakazakii]ELY3830391.1 hypothetical protein [Cronobacter sakazakii]ELY4145616.1 hypothetical protein [Cronobacter sakazakii]
MNDVMLFGDGWSGEVVKIATRSRGANPISVKRESGTITFFITTYIFARGVPYLIGVSDLEPSQDEIEKAIESYSPEATTFPKY